MQYLCRNRRRKTGSYCLEKARDFLRESCPARFHVLAPANLSLDGESGTGDFEISDVSGDVSIKGGTGDRFNERQNFFKRGKNQKRNGSVEVKGLSGSAKVETGIEDISLVFPSGIRLSASLDAPLGKRVNEFDSGGELPLPFVERLVPWGPPDLMAEMRIGEIPCLRSFTLKGRGLQVSAHSGTGNIYGRKAK